VGSLQKLVELLEANQQNLATFLHEDKRGRAVVPFLVQLAQHFSSEQTDILQQTHKLEERIDYIKVIVQKQQEYAKTTRMTETIALNELVDEAVSLTNATLSSHAIEITINVQAEPVTVERAEIVHILVNLLSNAKHALQDIDQASKQIIVTGNVQDGLLVVSVRDNGVGIAPENRSRIFGYGFTTKKDGHGFGLHDAANAAKRMRGALVCRDSALESGSTFVLTVPCDARKAAEPSEPRLEAIGPTPPVTG
jgi:C4-dicarboxylate-specific signal transduction histidine kinase